jgi:hypothetical protein
MYGRTYREGQGWRAINGNGAGGGLAALVEEAFDEPAAVDPELCELLGRQYERLTSRLEAVRQTLRAGASDAAAAALALYASELERQLRVEEDVVFRELERLDGGSRRPTLVLWMEHGELRSLLDQARDALQHGRDLLPGLDRLAALWLAHRTREGLLLCSLLEQAQDLAATDRLLRCLAVCAV